MARLATLPATGARPGQLLALFLAMHVINHVDRHLVASLAPQIMADLALSRGQFAFIAGLAFSLVYAVAALGAGLLADRIGHARVLAAGVGTWSLFTAACGLATGFWSMLAMRPLVAAGEATLVPTATSIILERTPPAARATATGIFFMGIPLGIGASYLVAAVLGPALGWRRCFLLMGALGLAATLVMLRLHNRPARGAATPSGARLRHWWALLRTRPRLRLASLAIVMLHAHMATAAFTQLWLTTDKGLGAARAASLYGGMFILFGMVGAAGAGAFTDQLQRRGVDRARALALLLLALVPLLLCYRLAPGGSELMLAGMAASVIFFTAAYGPCFAIIEQELPAEVKATATGINMLLINVVMIGGLGLVIGMASDALAAQGIAGSWTWPLLGADALAFTGIIALLACPPQRAATVCS